MLIDYTIALFFVVSLLTVNVNAERCFAAKRCSYNGCWISNAKTDDSGTCNCYPQWTGTSCTVLNLLPAKRNGGLHSPYDSKDRDHDKNKKNNGVISKRKTSSWGGSILLDKATGVWHMYAAEMINNCGIDYWIPNSRVVHAVADTYEGPFTVADVVVEPYAHEPNAVRGPNGEWIIYMSMRHPLDPDENFWNCTSSNIMSTKTSSPYRRRTLLSATLLQPRPNDTYMTYSHSPHGPWSKPVKVLDTSRAIWDGHEVLIDTNLAVTFIDATSIVGIWRKCNNSPKGSVCENQCCTFPYLLTASNWKDPTTYHAHIDRGPIFDAILSYGSEDPMVWTNIIQMNDNGEKKDIIKAILHDEQGPSRTTAIGRYAFSDDGGKTWVYSQEDAYNGTVFWTDDDDSYTTLFRRERPHMVVEDGIPLAVSNGVQESTNDDRSWTLVQPINQL
mmetsp:Transcript_14870/g.22875  ORF Transcript_14870/g.22875 Transcript_14870/m.22875 type:complete len:445 (+) Transcript_14870:143-1477(+)